MQQRTTITVTIGADGTGTGTSQQPVTGLIERVYYDANAGAASGTDFTVKEANFTYPQIILAALNVNTDGWYSPRCVLHNGADASVLTGPVDFFDVNDNIKVEMAQATQGQVFKFELLWDDKK